MLWKGKGCPYCLNSGYQDRTAIFEIFTVDDLVREQTMKRIGSTFIKSDAIKRGMRTLRMDGARKVLAGKTTPGRSAASDPDGYVLDRRVTRGTRDPIRRGGGISLASILRFTVMPVYNYKALKDDGGADAGVIDADSPKDARLKLKNRRLHVTDLQTLGGEEGGTAASGSAAFSSSAGAGPNRSRCSPASWRRCWAPASR
mgnify:CR=1 FL=1